MGEQNQGTHVEKYGLVVAIFLIVGSIVGSGIFTVTYRIASATGYNILIGFIALVIGALIMVVASTVYGTIVTESGKAGGLTEFAEVTSGKRAAYTVGFYKATVFIPILTAILSFFTSRFIIMLFTGWEQMVVDTAAITWIIAPFIALGFLALNFYKPIIAGKFQVVGTILPVALLLFIGIVGTILGLTNGNLIKNLTEIPTAFPNGDLIQPVHWFAGLASGVAISKFAYEGWVIATTVGNDIKDKRKNLPKALLFGTLIVLTLYSLFFIGIASFNRSYHINAGSPSEMVIEIFGAEWWGSVVLFIIVLSCSTTVNGLSMSAIRAPQLVAATGNGFKPELFAKTNENGLSFASTIYAFIAILLFILIVFFAQFGLLRIGYDFIDIGVTQVMVIPIVIIYMQHTRDFIFVMRNYKQVGILKRFIIPTCALFGAGIVFTDAITNPSLLLGVVISLALLAIAQLGYKTKNTANFKHSPNLCQDAHHGT